MHQPRRPTLGDVAARVGVTRMTVSRALRNPAAVSEALRRRILEAADALGYVASRAPSMLSRARSRSIGILVPSVTNQVFADVLAGATDAADAADRRLMIAHYGYDPAAEERAIASLLSYGVDALILSDREHTARALRLIEAAALPVVEIMDVRSPALQQTVGFDNVDAAYEMTRAMIARGRRRIAYAAVRLDPRTRQRQDGYARAMAEAGLEPRVVESAEKSSFALGATMVASLLDGPAPADGLFCTNDDIAVGACFELRRRGLEAPGPISVAGFHGLDVGQAMTPRLASVFTPRAEMGSLAVECVLARLGGAAHEPASIDLGYRIDEGETL
ncbi:substrate-binding domain-containing protein [Rubrimonas sp.]|uniref:substrate-binding domain-containing protein n=1 Tax=Rubrimonas sp. TaxID=2036015 RepID=UPI002FDEE4BA